MDVLSFVSILIFYIWVVQPVTAGSTLWNEVFITAALVVAALSLWRRGVTLERIGLRFDNLPRAIVIYVGGAVLYAGVALLWHRESIVLEKPNWPDLWGATELLAWAFLQQFCLLAFLLNRLREILGREALAAVAAAGIFAFFHLPNPFLTVYCLGGGLFMAWIFLRWPNLPAAALAHATTSALVGELLPREVTGWMKVGPLYWWAG